MPIILPDAPEPASITNPETFDVQVAREFSFLSDVAEAISGKALTTDDPLILEADVTTNTYFNANAPDGWLLDENFGGDTAVGLGEISGSCYRIKDIATITLSVECVAFSIDASDESSILGELDINTIAQDAGWFDSIIDARFGWATGHLMGAFGDTPLSGFELTALNGDGRLYFITRDTTHIPSQSSNATSMELRLGITLGVQD